MYQGLQVERKTLLTYPMERHMDRSLIVGMKTTVRMALLLIMLFMLLVSLLSCNGGSPMKMKPKHSFSTGKELQRAELRIEFRTMEVNVGDKLVNVSENLVVRS
jgi:hypothetical protein